MDVCLLVIIDEIIIIVLVLYWLILVQILAVYIIDCRSKLRDGAFYANGPSWMKLLGYLWWRLTPIAFMVHCWNLPLMISLINFFFTVVSWKSNIGGKWGHRSILLRFCYFLLTMLDLDFSLTPNCIGMSKLTYPLFKKWVESGIMPSIWHEALEK